MLKKEWGFFGHINGISINVDEIWFTMNKHWSNVMRQEKIRFF